MRESQRSHSVKQASSSPPRCALRLATIDDYRSFNGVSSNCRERGEGSRAFLANVSLAHFTGGSGSILLGPIVDGLRTEHGPKYRRRIHRFVNESEKKWGHLLK